MEASLLDSLGTFLHDAPLWGYLLLGATFIVRGEIAILVGTFLALKGYISFPTLWATAAVSVLLGDNLIYLFGRLTRGTRINQFLEAKLPFLTRLRTYLERHFIKIILLAKYAVGLVMVTILASGWAGIPFRRFIMWHTIGMSVWLVIMSATSYVLLSGLGYLQAVEVLGKIEVGILVFIVLFITAEIFIQRRLKRAAQEDTHRTHWQDILRRIGDRF